MSRFVIILIGFLCSSILLPPRSKPIFGVNIAIGANSQITTYVCYLYNGYSLNRKRIMDKKTFIKFVSGEWPSIYNPNGINFFEEHGISLIEKTEERTSKTYLDCAALDSLWKIRFSTYPFLYNNELGWSNKLFKPSPNQEIYLKERYNINHIDGEYFLDTNFWLLLSDVVNPEWVDNYKSIH